MSDRLQLPEWRLTPTQARMLIVLESTPGMVTDAMLRWQLWGRMGRKQPKSIAYHISHIRRVTGRKIVRFGDRQVGERLGYSLVR